MKIILSIISLLAIGIIIYFFALASASKSKSAPGLTAGHLSSCPDKKNCVSSEAENKTHHKIESIPLPSIKSEEKLQQAKSVILEMGGSIVLESNNYIAATFTSDFFGFIDDFEIKIDNENQVLQIRAASRVGRSDLGVNKARVEIFRSQLTQ